MQQFLFMGVDIIHIRSLKRNLNQRQKDYLSNVFAVSGGAIIYTIWQGIFPIAGNVSIANFIQYLIMGIIGIVMIITGLLIQSKEIKETGRKRWL